MKTTQALPGLVLDQLARIGEGIRIARMRRRMTQEDLASRVGTTFHTIRRIEQGAPGTAIGGCSGSSMTFTSWPIRTRPGGIDPRGRRTEPDRPAEGEPEP
jgi:DNA-binding XRE family transcriptional regulator